MTVNFNLVKILYRNFIGCVYYNIMSLSTSTILIIKHSTDSIIKRIRGDIAIFVNIFLFENVYLSILCNVQCCSSITDNSKFLIYFA